MRILVLNGINLNMTGLRQPEVYGSETLEDINKEIAEYAAKNGAECDFFQTNFEGELAEKLHGARGVYDGIVLNAGAWTHYSYGIRDAIASIDLPVVETHMSDITKREEFRRLSVIAPVCAHTIMGFGKYSYIKAVEWLLQNEVKEND